jgi:O-antigen ligase
MGSSFALFVFVVGIGGLFFLDRDKSARTSKAVWLPVIWLWITGSRPVSEWLGMGTPEQIPGQLPSTSPFDQSLVGLLMLFGILVIRRRRHVRAVLKASWPILFYFSFCLVSLLWSDFPRWGFQRWVRALGELVMVLIVVTDAQPTAAFRRFLSRVGFVLLPASVLSIEFLGQAGYDPAGYQTNPGVTENKNGLGLITFVLTLGTLWQVLSLLRDRKQPNRARRLLAQCTLLSIGIWLLYAAHSATSTASFALGAALMLATALPLIGRRPAAVHALVLAILLGGALTLDLGGRTAVAQAMGRSADLTGRTKIWEILIPMAPNPIIGAGYETFWLGWRPADVKRQLHYVIGQAHNGYIEVYLNLGMFGLGLIALILAHGYRGAIGAFRREPTFGGLFLAYILTAATYNIAEAGFRMPGMAWFFLLLSVLAASRATAVEKNRPQTWQEPAHPTFVVRDCDTADLNPAWMNSRV